MKYDVIVIGGGASGLMAAYSAAKHAADSGKALRVCVLEKMPRPARKVMITGKGRCNFTNVKDWGEFSAHIRSGAQFVRPAWRSFPPERVVEFFESAGMPAVVERGDRAYPASYRSADVVDTLVRECHGAGVVIQTEAEVTGIEISRLAPLARNDRDGRREVAEAREGSSDIDNASLPKHFCNGSERPSPAGAASDSALFTIQLADGTVHLCSRLIIATGGLSYPATGSTGDGFAWARALGHTVTPLFPSLTALVPKGYKDTRRFLNYGSASARNDREGNRLNYSKEASYGQIIHDPRKVAGAGEGTSDFENASLPKHFCNGSERPSPAGATDLPKCIHRETPLTEFGQKLCGASLKNVGVNLLIQGTVTDSEFGDIDFTDGGIEGPIGFQLSRKAVKAMTNGSKAALVIDLKPGVPLTELTTRIKELWAEIDRDPRSRGIREKERCRILLGKLMPRELIPGFTAAHPEIITLEHRGRADTKVWVNLVSIAKALKEWRFELDGFVGWERTVVTAGGISTDEIVPKTLESRIVPGLYFCGEALDIDADTGGYNLQLAFCTGYLAGQNASDC